MDDIRRVTTLQGFARVHLQRKQNMSFFFTIMRSVIDTLNTVLYFQYEETNLHVIIASFTYLSSIKNLRHQMNFTVKSEL